MANGTGGVLYTKDYQCTLLAHLALDEQFFKSNIDTLQLTDFELPACQLVLEVLRDYFYQFKHLPNSMDMLMTHIDFMQRRGKTLVRLTPEENESLYYVLQIICSYIGKTNVEYFRVQLPDYLKSVRTSQAMDAYQAQIKMGQSPEGFLNQIAKINKEVVVNKGIVIDNMYGNPEPILTAEEFCRISTGLWPLNARLSGGLGAGELGMITACPGVGKTTAMLNFMDGANIAGWFSLFMSLEMRGRRIKHRHQSIVAGIDAHYFKMPMQDWPEAMLQRWNAIMTKEYRSFGMASIADLSSEKHKLADIDLAVQLWKDEVNRQGGDVNRCKAVYVDFLDRIEIKGLAIGSEKDAKSWDLLKEACYELSNIAKRHDVSLWTATQGTREADSKEVLEMKHVSGGYHKSDALDVGIGLGVIYDALTVQRNDRANDNIPEPTDDDSIDNPQAQVVPCNRRLMVSFFKNRDNPKCAVEIFQGSTLKFWARQADAIKDDELLKQGNFVGHMAGLDRQIGKKKI